MNILNMFFIFIYISIICFNVLIQQFKVAPKYISLRLKSVLIDTIAKCSFSEVGFLHHYPVA